MPVPAQPNELWVLDFVSDQLVCGQRFRILAIYDVCIRRCLATVADFSVSGRRVARELDRLIAVHGKPKAIGSDTELTSNAILTWTAGSGVDWHYMYGRPPRCKVQSDDVASLGLGAFMYAACVCGPSHDRWP